MASCTRVLLLVPHTKRLVTPVSGWYFANKRAHAVTSFFLRSPPNHDAR